MPIRTYSNRAHGYAYCHTSHPAAASHGANIYAFASNGLGDRLSQTVNGTLTRYTLDPGAGLTQVLSDGTSTYLYGVGRIAQQATSLQYYGADALGSVRQLYDTSGQIVANTRYDPYGTVLGQDGAATSIYGFAGEQFDSWMNLEYLRARYYDPAQGRFLTRDAWGGDPTVPMSYNSWLYVYANPANLTDPTGQSATLPQVREAMVRLAAAGSADIVLNPSDDYIASLLDCVLAEVPDPVASQIETLVGSSQSDISDSDPDGYFVGAAIVKTLGFGKVGVTGLDVVYDFKHQQRGAFSYSGRGVNTTIVGFEVDLYDGFLEGFKNDVSDYKGPFVAVDAGVGAPLGKMGGVSISGVAFSSADPMTCEPTWELVGAGVSYSAGIGLSMPFVSGAATCSTYKYEEAFGRAQYPKGLAGGIEMAFDILKLSKSGIAAGAMRYAIDYSLAIEEGKIQVNGY